MSDRPGNQAGPPPLEWPGFIVSPDWVAQHLSHPALRLFDLRLREEYDEGHLPGAVWVDLQALSCTVNSVPGMVLPPELFAEQMRSLGLSLGGVVVIYDDHWGMPSARLLWALARYGYTMAAVLNGGADRWQAEGRPWTAEPYSPPAGNFVAGADEAHLATGAWLTRQGDDAEIALVDTRTPGEYAQGHLPGAICWDWLNGVPVEGWDFQRPSEKLLEALTSLGITPDKEIITYCQSGARAAHTYLLLRNLGYPKVRLYDGSWLEWSRHYQK